MFKEAEPRFSTCSVSCLGSAARSRRARCEAEEQHVEYSDLGVQSDSCLDLRRFLGVLAPAATFEARPQAAAFWRDPWLAIVVSL